MEGRCKIVIIPDCFLQRKGRSGLTGIKAVVTVHPLRGTGVVERGVLGDVFHGKMLVVFPQDIKITTLFGKPVRRFDEWYTN